MSKKVVKSVVIDNGSGSTRVGFSGDHTPTIFNTTVSFPKKKFYVGDDYQSNLGFDTKSPVEHGIITDFDLIDKIWGHTFDNVLKISSKDQPVLLTEVPFNPKENREKMAEIMFEKYSTPEMFIGIQAVLSLYASGRTTGIVAELGEGVSHIVPINEGYSVGKGILRFDLAGNDLDDYAKKLLLEGEFSKMFKNCPLEFASSLKEKHFYVAPDYDKELKLDVKTLQKTYELPDGSFIKVGEEKFKCPEALFKPSLMGLKFPGIHEHIFESIGKLSTDIQSSMYQNIVLSGGSSLINGFEKRLKSEMEGLVPKEKIKVFAPPNRRNLAWIGGSILSALPTFKDITISKKEYEENGKSIVHKKLDNIK